MSIEENKDVILRMYELLNERNLDAYIELMAPDCAIHTNIGIITREQEEKGDFFKSFPDATNTIDEIVGEGYTVAFQVTYRGTHKGEFLGIAPTGKRIKMTNTAIYRIVDGKVVGGQATLDMFGLFQQIGAIPPTIEVWKNTGNNTN